MAPAWNPDIDYPVRKSKRIDFEAGLPKLIHLW